MPLRPTNLDQVPATTMEYRLPSAGLPYLPKCPDFPDTIKITPYTLETEGYLMSNATMHSKMAFVTGKVCHLPGLLPEDLLVADQFFILAVARAQTYGETYSFRAQCPNCSHLETIHLKVPDELPVRVWKRAEPPNLEHRLPCGDTIRFRFLTVREDEATNRYVRDLLSKSGNASAVTDGPLAYMRRMAYHLEAVNGDRPDNIGEADQYVMRLKGLDMVAFTDAIDRLGCGIQYEWLITCDKCEYLYERSIPLAGDFFRRNRLGRTIPPASPPPAAQQPPPHDQPA